MEDVNGRHKHKTKNFLLIIFAIAFSCLYGASSSASQIKNLTILAEPNMVASLTKIARIYSQKNAVIVSIGFASANDLIADIDSGEPADVFISAHRDWISNLKQKGLIDIYNIGHIANDELVLATSSNNLTLQNYFNGTFDFEEILKIIDEKHLSLIVDSDQSSLGRYSKNILETINLSNIKLFTKLNEDKNSLINLLQENSDGYAILLASQASNRTDIKILAQKKNQPIFYQAVVIAGDNMDVAREFLKFLKSAQAKNIFVENGFILE